MITFATVAEKYMIKIAPTKASRTHKDYQQYLEKLVKVFGEMDINQFRPQHIRSYLDKRSAKVRANREIALFSVTFNYVRKWGYTDPVNPFQGIRKTKNAPETGMFPS